MAGILSLACVETLRVMTQCVPFVDVAFSVKKSTVVTSGTCFCSSLCDVGCSWNNKNINSNQQPTQPKPNPTNY
eukprot:m.112319 g.112319  ORF g.112319 m.112319 type:complete len:74 (-) comp9252_c0_seq5:11-232(-)